MPWCFQYALASAVNEHPDELLQDGFWSPTWLHSLPASVHATRALFGSFWAAYPGNRPRPKSDYLRKPETPMFFPIAIDSKLEVFGTHINIDLITFFGCWTQFSVVSAMCQWVFPMQPELMGVVHWGRQCSTCQILFPLQYAVSILKLPPFLWEREGGVSPFRGQHS